MNIRHAARICRAAITVPVLLFTSLLPATVVHAGGPGPCDLSTAPTALIYLSPDKSVGQTNVSFDGSQSVACTGSLVDYRWSFGDGTAADGMTTTHTYGVGIWQPSLTVTDSTGQSTTTSRTVTIKASNTAPIAQNDSVTVVQGSTTVINVAANDSDPDGDPLAWSLASSPSDGAIVASDVNGNFSYDANSNYVGTDSFTYSVDDGFGGLSTAIVSITVVPHVVAQDDSATTPQTSAVTVPVLANDSAVDNDPLKVTFAGMTSGGGSVAVSSDGQNVVFTPFPDWSGTAVFHYTVADANEPQFTATANATINVTPVNHAPVAKDGNYSAPENTPISGNVLNFASDPDGDTLTAAAMTQPAHGSLSLNSNGTYTYTPNTNYFGVDSFTYQVTDPSGATSQVATIALNVTYVNHAPVAQNDTLTTAEDTAGTVRVLANDTDPDGDSLHVSAISSAPTHGSVTINSDGSITYTPAANYNGTDSFVYTAADTAGATSNATVSITVTSVNDLPTASFTWTVGSRRNASFTATASDVDGTVVRYDWNFGDGTSATSTEASIQHSYKKSGSYIVTLTVTDDQGGQSTYQQTVSL